MNKLKENIITISRKMGLSISGLERKAGLNKTFISNFLYDRSKNPGVDSIIKIADALNITVDKLLGTDLDDKTYDLDIARKDILLEVAHYLLVEVAKRNDNNLNLEKLFDAIYEIYILSLREGKFDKEFADWLINSRLY